jgi:WXXGXW repeat (2 copies)
MNNLVKRCVKGSVLVGILLATAPAVQARTYVRIEAPAIRVESHEERPNQVWQSGYWRWRGQKHEWTGGRYTAQRQGRHWVDGRWDHSSRGYYWTAGSWQR